MSTARRIARNTSFLMSARVVSLGTGLAYIVVAARYLGVAAFGLLAFAMAFTAIFGVPIDLNMAMLTTREVARDHSLAGKYLANLIALRLFLSIAVFGPLVVATSILGYTQHAADVIYLMYIYTVTSVFLAIFYAIFQAFERMEYQSFAQVLASGLSLVGALIAISLKLDVLGFVLIYTTINLVPLAYCYVICARNFVVPKLEVDWTFWKGIFTEALPLAFLGVISILYFRVDVLILSVLKGDAAVGLYGVGYMLSETSILVPTLLIASLFPVAAKLHQSSKDSFIYALSKAAKYLLYVALPMALVVTLWARPFVTTFYGLRYFDSAVALQILIWAAALMYVDSVLSMAFISANRQRVLVIITAIAVAFNIILNLFLITRFNFLGASVTAVATEVVVMSLSTFFLKRSGYDLGLRRIALAPVFGLAAMVAISVALLLQNVPLFVVTAVDIVVYASILYKFGVDEEDRRLIMGLLKKPSTINLET